MQLPKVYEPIEYESDIYALWEKSNAFVPKNRGSKQNFSVVSPPPNANGNLHLGHALTNAVHDVLTRYYRMRGRASLYLPGADHAGFETWVVYEKELNKQGKTRFDFSREDLYEQVWDFVQLNKSNFDTQFRALGASCDWSKFAFTLDKKVVDQAYKTFKKMWDDKLIYRGERLVNFCTFHGTGFADIEVEYKTEVGKMYYIKFSLNAVDGVADKEQFVLVATTRPETMLADVAVAVHPEDKRFYHLHGRTVTLPLSNREVPIIADKMVDPEFGTGAVKITAAHDPNDFEVAVNHNLPKLKAITEEGKIGYDAPRSYHGLDVLEGRQRVIDDLDKLGLIEKTEEHEHRVGHCYKCDTVIQPLLREQWFIDMKPLAKRAIKALGEGKITFYPEAKKDQAITYLKGIRDWNISRQIAWGIPIPAFQNVDDASDWIYDEAVAEEFIKKGDKTYRRDPDVFDTWFSSGQWPYITLDYPEGEDYKQFYPLSVMETGFDILYQWVCRMIMLGLYITDEVPFKDVYLHGLVLDEHGQKMSKSKGNVINPMDALNKYGSDALRMGLLTGQTAGNNQPYQEPKVVAARNFCNKLWNVARFIEDKIGDDYKVGSTPKPESLADYWIMYKLQQSTEEVATFIEKYRLGEAYENVYHLVWDDLADWYLEASKKELNKSVLAYALQTVLKLVHPFAPFVSETIWQTLKWEENSLLITSPWADAVKVDQESAKDFEVVMDIVKEIRYIRGVMALRGDLTLYHKGEKFLSENEKLLSDLSKTKVKEIESGHGLHLTSTKLNCWLDIDLESSKRFASKLQEKINDQKAVISQLETRLNNKSYVKNAPKELVEETNSQLEAAKELFLKLDKEYKRFAV